MTILSVYGLLLSEISLTFCKHFDYIYLDPCFWGSFEKLFLLFAAWTDIRILFFTQRYGYLYGLPRGYLQVAKFNF